MDPVLILELTVRGYEIPKCSGSTPIMKPSRSPSENIHLGLRPLDDIRYDRRHCGLNKQISQRDCDWSDLNDSVERPPNRSRVVVVTTA